MKSSKFEPSYFKGNDELGKTSTATYLKSVGCDVEVNQQLTGQDWVVRKGDSTFYAEAQICGIWTATEDYTPHSLFLPHRKGRYLDKGDKTLFFVWNTTGNLGIIFWSTHIKDPEIVSIPNPRHPNGEPFIKIDMAITKRISI